MPSRRPHRANQPLRLPIHPPWRRHPHRLLPPPHRRQIRIHRPVILTIRRNARVPPVIRRHVGVLRGIGRRDGADARGRVEEQRGLDGEVAAGGLAGGEDVGAGQAGGEGRGAEPGPEVGDVVHEVGAGGFGEEAVVRGYEDRGGGEG